MKLIDNLNRIHDYVRISLIDKCNLNCIYCNPSNTIAQFHSNKSILSYEELLRLITIFVRDLEVKKIRFTGGEPLIRKDVMEFFQMISAVKEQYDFEIGITTNGTHLFDKLERLHHYGVDKLNISLDTLKPAKFIAVTGSDCFNETLSSINKAVTLGFKSVKVNSVIMKNINEDELACFVEYFELYPITLRFIEYMPFSGNHWNGSKFVSWEEMKTIIETKYSLREIPCDGKVSKDYFVEGAQLKIGFISSISDHFCESCNRLRVTATGQIKNCLFSTPTEKNLKSLLADTTMSDDRIAEFVASSLQTKWLKHPSVDELSTLNENNMMSIGG